MHGRHASRLRGSPAPMSGRRSVETAQERVGACTQPLHFVLRRSCGRIQVIARRVRPAIEMQVAKPDLLYRCRAAGSSRYEPCAEQHAVAQPEVVGGLKSVAACLDPHARPDRAVAPRRDRAGGTGTENQRECVSRVARCVGIDRRGRALEPRHHRRGIVGGRRCCERDPGGAAPRGRGSGRLRTPYEEHDGDCCTPAPGRHSAPYRPIRQRPSPCDAPAPRGSSARKAPGTRGRSRTWRPASARRAAAQPALP